MSQATLEAALQYAQRGWRIIPLTPGQKKPCILTGKDHLEAASTDPEVLTRWFLREFPRADVGVACGAASGLFVLDSDGPAGVESLAQLQERFGPLPGDCPKATTTRKGAAFFHLYIQHPGPEYRVTSKKIAPGLDIKGDGGIVALPPCQGRTWQTPVNGPLPGITLEWRQFLTENARSVPREITGKIADTTRNTTLISLAGSLRYRDLPLEVIRVALQSVNAEMCDPPLDPAEVDKVARSIGRYVPGSSSAAEALDLSNLLTPAHELYAREFPPVQWAVEGYIPEGLTVLAGKPKVKKSWLVLDWCLATSLGIPTLGEVSVKHGAALYLALEDNDRRLHGRMHAVLAKHHDAPHRLHFATQWPRLHEGGLTLIDEWLETHSDAALVGVDTLARIRRPARTNASVYQEDVNALKDLQALANARSVSVVVVHHLRKAPSLDDPFDEVSGSTGITGTADTTVVLTRGENAADGFLYLRGRDVEDQEKALRFDTKHMRWKLVGDAEEFRQNALRREILEYLKRADDPVTGKQIARELGKSWETVRKHLYHLRDEGYLNTPSGGRDYRYQIGVRGYIDDGDL